MQTTVKPSTARRALAAGIAAAAAAGSTAFTVHSASAEEIPATEPTCSLTTTLPIPEGLEYTAVDGMSDDGSVVSYHALPLDQSGVSGLGAFPLLYADGEVTEVPMPGNLPAIDDVNSSGNGTGYSTQDGYDVPYLWRDGELTELPFPGTGARTHGINEHGDVVGSGADPDGDVALLWPADGSGPVELPIPDDQRSGVAHDIGDDGTIIGAVYNENGTPTAYMWHPDGSGEPMPAPEGADPDESWSIAVDINGDWASGVYFMRGQESPAQGTRWNQAEGTAEQTDLHRMVAVSAEGTVAGYLPGTPNNAAIQKGDTVTELAGVVPPEDRRMTEYADEISADGTLVAGTIYVGSDDEGAIMNAVLWTCE